MAKKERAPKDGCCRVESIVSVDERGQMVLPKEIREAGFGAVEVVGEKAFPPELILDNPDARRIAEQHGLSADDLADTVGSVVSLNIRAKKPA